jgi:hypothetical protein
LSGGRLVVYVTSHGFGHLNRTAAVLDEIPAEVPITIRAHSNLYIQWRDRLKRDATLEHYVSDVGAVNPPGDSAAVAAHHAGVPGFLMANFTWADIYAPYARSIGGEAPGLVAELRRAYRLAVLTFRMEPALAMSWLSPKVDVGMVVKDRRDRRAELRDCFGLNATDKLVYVYVGRYGQNDLDWSRLERVAGRRVHFVSYSPAPEPRPRNLHVVPSADWPGGELIAASDAVVAKAGYGTVCEAMTSGTPIVYPPRPGFSEYRVLDRALRAWGGGVPISSRDFLELNLERALARALELRPGPPPFSIDGATSIANRLAAACLGTDERNASSLRARNDHGSNLPSGARTVGE